MIDSNIIERIISSERIEPYLKYHEFDHHKAFAAGKGIHRALAILTGHLAGNSFFLLCEIEL